MYITILTTHVLSFAPHTHTRRPAARAPQELDPDIAKETYSALDFHGELGALEESIAEFDQLAADVEAAKRDDWKRVSPKARHAAAMCRPCTRTRHILLVVPSSDGRPAASTIQSAALRSRPWSPRPTRPSNRPRSSSPPCKMLGRRPLLNAVYCRRPVASCHCTDTAVCDKAQQRARAKHKQLSRKERRDEEGGLEPSAAEPGVTSDAADSAGRHGDSSSQKASRMPPKAKPATKKRPGKAKAAKATQCRSSVGHFPCVMHCLLVLMHCMFPQ